MEKTLGLKQRVEPVPTYHLSIYSMLGPSDQSSPRSEEQQRALGTWMSGSEGERRTLFALAKRSCQMSHPPFPMQRGPLLPRSSGR